MSNDHSSGPWAPTGQPLPPPVPPAAPGTLPPPVAGSLPPPLPGSLRLPAGAWPEPAPEPPRRRRRWVWLAVVAAVLAVALVAGGTVVALSRDREPAEPSAWAPEVADLVPFVEKAKGAAFDRPVRVVVLDEAAFRERVTQDQGDLTDQDRQDLEQTEGELRALGLDGGEGSLFDQVNTMTGGGVAAFYDPETEEIVIPAATDAPLAQQQTLVHELTHALQDQLGQLQEPEDSDASAAFDALVEGDAEHVATQWVDTLSERERAELDRQVGTQSDTASDELDSVNPVLVAIFTSPYSLGEAMAAALDEAGRLDDAFEDPPASFADVQDPARWLEPATRVEVEAPALKDGEQQQGDDDTFGAQALYLMLATALEPADALVVADGWGGDRMRSFESTGGASCMRVAVTGVDDAATGRIEDAVGTWVEARPEGSATTARTGDVVVFDACDLGSAGEAGLSDAVANLPGLRASLMPQFQDAGLSFDEAVCASTRILGLVDPELFYLETLSASQERSFQAAVDATLAACSS